MALCSYFAGLSHKPRGGPTTIPALVGFREYRAYDKGGASEDVGLWEPGRASTTDLRFEKRLQQSLLVSHAALRL